MMRFIESLINVLAGIAEFFLGFRFILRLFGANPATPFVQWIYEASEPILSPFRGIFPAHVIQPGSVFEFATLFAMVAYAVLAYLLIVILQSIDQATRTHTEIRP